MAKLLVLLVLLLPIVIAESLSELDDRFNGSVTGTDFILAFPLNNVAQTTTLSLIVSNGNAESVQILVSSNYQDFDAIEQSIPASTVQKISIPKVEIQTLYRDYMSTDTVFIEDKGIRVQASSPITLTAVSGNFPSSDAFQVLPVELLEQRYLAISSPNTMNNFGNIISVIAFTDNTRITIGNANYTLTRLQSASISSLSNSSGMIITGDQPFAVVSACMNAFTRVNDSGNYAAIMMRPPTDWSNVYPLVPLQYNPVGYYLVVSDTNSNVVNWVDNTLLLNVGMSTLVVTASSQITGSAPLQVTQLGTTSETHSLLGDAFYMPIPSARQLSNVPITFLPCGSYAPNNQMAIHNFVRIFTQPANAGQIYLDNFLISANLYRNASTFVYYEQLISSNYHTLSTRSDTALFAAVTYSYGASCGCGYTLAANN